MKAGEKSDIFRYFSKTTVTPKEKTLITTNLFYGEENMNHKVCFKISTITNPY